MAKKQPARREARDPSPIPEVLGERDRPKGTMIVLAVGFVALVLIAVVTVFLPELRDDAGSAEESEALTSSAPGSARTDGTGSAPSATSAP